jgi:hypothetical protein
MFFLFDTIIFQTYRNVPLIFKEGKKQELPQTKKVTQCAQEL